MQPALDRRPPPSSMSAAIAAEPRGASFRVGAVVARTFSTWRRHVLVFSAITLGAYLPLVLFSILAGVPVPGVTSPSPNPFDAEAATAAGPVAAAQIAPQLGMGLGLSYAAMALLFLVGVGAMTHGVIHDLAGRRVSLGGMIAAGLRRALPLLVVGVLSYLIIVVGMILLVVPGIVFSCALAVAIPAVVVERPGVLGAIRRSFRLTKGNRLAILGVFLVLGVVAFGAGLVAALVVPALAFLSPTVATVLGLVVNVVFGTLFWVAPGVVYHDLRVAKEGVATAQLAAVFE